MGNYNIDVIVSVIRRMVFYAVMFYLDKVGSCGSPPCSFLFPVIDKKLNVNQLARLPYHVTDKRSGLLSLGNVGSYRISSTPVIFFQSRSYIVLNLQSSTSASRDRYRIFAANFATAEAAPTPFSNARNDITSRCTMREVTYLRVRKV